MLFFEHMQIVKPRSDNTALHTIQTTVTTLSIGTDRPEQSVDPDLTQQNAESNQGLYCLLLIQHNFGHINR